MRWRKLGLVGDEAVFVADVGVREGEVEGLLGK